MPETHVVAPGPDALVLVGIGVIRRERRLLVRQRIAPSALAGCWEFPGGKCRPGESPRDAAARECQEETGLEVELGRLLRTVRHDYAHAAVELHFFEATIQPENAEPAAETGFVWVDLQEVRSLPFPEANAPVLAELTRLFA